MKTVVLVTLGALIVAMSSHASQASDVDPTAYAPYKKQGFPKTFAKWGANGVKRIDAYRKKAAYAAAASSSCDHVEYAELSDNRSTPPDRISVFVDCRNGQRFYFTAVELDAAKPARSTADVTGQIPDQELIAACEKSIRAALRFPSSFDKSWFTTNVYRATGGNAVVTFDFTAKNGFGLDLPQSARCVTDDRGMHPPEIANR